jgi:uncharacterized protein YggE
MTATLTVRGEAVAAAKPDDADLTFTLSALHATPDEALDDVAERTRELKEIFDANAIAERDRITTGISVREEREYVQGHYEHRGYMAQTSVIVRLDDPEVIGRLMKSAIEDADASVSGPRWRVAADNPAHTEARKAAIVDARRRADAYADALGVRVGAIADVSEPGLKMSVSHAVVADRALYSASAEPELEVEAGDIDIRAAIDVVYRIEQ